VPFVRVSRDKRGYELISLVHVFGGRRGKPSKPRVLYVFRTPPGVKVGREPFDESVRRELKAQNPGVVFDWKRLSNIPVPSPDVEYWRERRRVEKAAKAARRAEDLAEAAAGQVSPDPSENGEGGDEVEVGVGLLEEPEKIESAEEQAEAKAAGESPVAEVVPIDPGTSAAAPLQAQNGAVDPGGRPPGHRRRRRRGGRRRHRHPGSSGAPPSPPAGSGQPASAHEGAEKPGDTPKVAGDTSKEA
jgi:hypothetical protein